MTGTEMLIEAMTRWGEHSEPNAVLLVYTDTAGEVWMKTNCSHTQTVGMAEYAKHFALATLLSQPEEDKT
jgi:hypothetical protein